MEQKRTWGDKRYYSLDAYLKETFGEKVYKLSLNAGMTCPNRDGTLGERGCIFCSAGGSGDFAASSALDILSQIAEAKTRVLQKTKCSKFIAYFQAYTNTYAPVTYLREVFYQAIQSPDIVALSIATRPDCLNQEILDLLQELNQIKPVWVELGLQTIHKATADFIRRGYELDCFDASVARLHAIGIHVIVHVILGLPYETDGTLHIESRQMILDTIRHITQLPIQGVKLQLLHVLEGTDLAGYAERFPAMTQEDYLDTLIACIELLPPHIVLHRVTGDGPRRLLIAPLWSTNKKHILNQLNHELTLRDTWQGKNCMLE